MGKSVVRRAGEGDAYWVLGGLYEVRASAEETGGEMTIMEMTVPKGMGPPPHTHAGAEALRVLKGTVQLHIGDDVIEGPEGSFFYIPSGTLERFEPISEIARVLVIYTPGGIDKFFAEVGERATRRELPAPSDTPPDFERMVAAAEKYGMQIQAPA